MPRDLPSGAVTFMFTDIEGSTRLSHDLGAGYADVLAEHRQLVRGVTAAHRGVEVDTQGDAFFVAFTAHQAHADADKVPRTVRERPDVLPGARM